MPSYKNSVTLEKRIEESNRQKNKNPTYVPVIVECEDTLAPVLKKRKYLIPRDITIAQFLFVLRREMKGLDPSVATFLFLEQNLVPAGEYVGKIYDDALEKRGVTTENQAKSDLFLYVYLAGENCFGKNL